MEPDFMVEDQGDGWWHCVSPLACFIVDGPTCAPHLSGEFWLVRTKPAIEWNGLGMPQPNDPMSHREPTDLALVMAGPRGEGSHSYEAWSIPVYPVAGAARTVSDAAWIGGLGIKARIAGLAESDPH